MGIAVIDDGMMFYASIKADTGELLHRETTDRRDLIAWVAAHGGRGPIVRLAIEATTDTAITNMLAAIIWGADRRAGRR